MKPWQVNFERQLIASQAEVWTTGMLWNEAQFLPESTPSRSAFDRWLLGASQTGHLKKVRGGIYLNAFGNKHVSPAAAAGFIRREAIPSLSWVLEQSWSLNNFGGPITCVVPMVPGFAVSNVSDVQSEQGLFTFRALPLRCYELPGVPVEAWRDTRYSHPRATPEKALCDWIYLGASPRSTLASPPLDLDLDGIKMERIRRIVKAMDMDEPWKVWLEQKRLHDADPEVRENAHVRHRP